MRSTRTLIPICAEGYFRIESPASPARQAAVTAEFRNPHFQWFRIFLNPNRRPAASIP